MASFPSLQPLPITWAGDILRWKVDRLLDDLAEIEPNAFLAAELTHLRIVNMSRQQILVIPSFLLLLSHAAAAGEPIDLTPCNDGHRVTHVSIQLDAGGNNLVRAQKDDRTA